jgi:hypothetical protein
MTRYGLAVKIARTVADSGNRVVTLIVRSPRPAGEAECERRRELFASR